MSKVKHLFFKKHLSWLVVVRQRRISLNYGLIIAVVIASAATWFLIEYAVYQLDRMDLITAGWVSVARPKTKAAPWNDHGYLRVSANGHYLEYEDGTDFFWLGDTAWHLPSLDQGEVTTYMQNRESKGFTVIQFVADNFHTFDNYQNEYAFPGSLPHSSLNPNEAYWQHIDYIIDEAANHNLYVLLVATWGERLNDSTWDDPYNHVYQYGQFLGNRYRNRENVIFCAAGEFQSVTGAYNGLNDPILEGYLRRIGQGIQDAADPGQLITIHGNPGSPGDDRLPSEFFHQDDWLDFYGNQSWVRPQYIDDMIWGDFQLTNPVKPTINLESAYEDGIVTNTTANCTVSVTPWGQRFTAYWSLFWGGFGFTYGHDRIAAMSGTHNSPWGTNYENMGELDQAALDDTGGGQMRYVRRLMESKPITERVPDQTIITSDSGIDTGDSPNKIVATRDINGTWAFVYLTKGGSVTVDMSKLSSPQVNARWYNPKNGIYTDIGTYANNSTRQFTTSSSGEGNDWVLVLESNAAVVCPDSACNGTETCATCSSDCGACPPNSRGWRVIYADSEEMAQQSNPATNAIDSDNNTIWHTEWSGNTPAHPHEIRIDLGSTYTVSGLKYLPRQDASINGTIGNYAFYVSTSATNWGSAVDQGSWAADQNEKTAVFTPKQGRYIRLVAQGEVNSNAWTSVAELGILYCGDNIVNGGEQCDDGNTSSGDGCSASCTTEASANSLIAHWTFDNNARDSVGTNDGTLMGGASYTAGIDGMAVQLDGSDDYVNIPGLLGQPGAISISLWARLNAPDTNGAEAISLGDYAALRVDDPNRGAEGFYHYATGWRGTQSDVFYAGTGWHHYVYTVEPGHQYFYTDGIQTAATTFSEPIAYSGLGANTNIGSHANGSSDYYFNGLIDDVRVYNYALTQTEITALYNAFASACVDIDQDTYDICSPGDPGDDGKPVDCDDNEPYAHPGGTKTCDTIDNDCSGTTDEGCDDDSDGYCDAAMQVYRDNTMCPNTPFIDGRQGDDCDDADNAVNPGATEICANSIDDDCDGQTDSQDTDCGAAACHRYTSSDPVSSGYGSAYNLGQNNPAELLVKTTCNTNSVNLDIGNGNANMLIYQQGHIYDGSNWQSITLSGASQPYTGWYAGNAGATDIPVIDMNAINYIVAYTCYWNGQSWRCGCADSACIDPCPGSVCGGKTGGLWQLQAFSN